MLIIATFESKLDSPGDLSFFFAVALMQHELPVRHLLALGLCPVFLELLPIDPFAVYSDHFLYFCFLFLLLLIDLEDSIGDFVLWLVFTGPPEQCSVAFLRGRILWPILACVVGFFDARKVSHGKLLDRL